MNWKGYGRKRSWPNLRYVRFLVLTAASMEFKVFCEVTPYRHLEVDRRFRGVYCLHLQGNPDDGGSTHL